jgi:hypothetical protein
MVKNISNVDSNYQYQPQEQHQMAREIYGTTLIPQQSCPKVNLAIKDGL